MNDFNKIKNELSQMLSEKRFNHSMQVALQAFKLAEIYGEDTGKAFLAGLVHDCCKEISKAEQLKIINQFGIILTDIEKTEPNIWHGYAASGYITEKWEIDDPDVCSAVKYHTCGRGNMSVLEKIIFVADLTSEDRNYPDSEKIREISYKNLDRAIYECYLYIIPFILKRKGRITQNTLDCYNDAASQISSEKE
ncbi:MAG: HD domain-containing protein [Ruminococcaceae bacterium]|nr:HD domain-containing protein [Oscillospiraceae bacterium]